MPRKERDPKWSTLEILDLVEAKGLALIANIEQKTYVT
jgi:hypothetical protein